MTESARKFTRHELALLASNRGAALLGAGYSASALRGAGYSLSALLSAGYSASALRGAGYSLSDLLGVGYSASDLLSAGYSASALLGAGYSASALLSAGYSLSDLRGAGYSLSALLSAGYSASALLDKTPLVERPYSRLLADIRAGKRKFDQKTWGPEGHPTPEPNICGTPMCTAGHFVNMAGEEGWKLKEEFGFAGAAALIHAKAHPDYPCQNFGPIPDAWALAYIEEMAEVEEKSATSK